MKLLVTTRYSKKCLNELGKVFDDIVHMPPTELKSRKEDEMCAILKEEAPDAVIVELDRITRVVLDENKGLKFIGVCRANPVNVDVAYASKLGIPVLVTPARNAQSVAELVIGQLIMFERLMYDAVPWLKNGEWRENPAYPFFHYTGHEICGRKVGFVGFGAVARALWNMLKSFGCEGAYYDAFINETINGCEYAPIENIFAESDIVSVHLPVNDSTKGMITGELMALMKPDALFVNSSRAVVADYDALYGLLRESRIRGALLDVFPNEPPSNKDYELIKLPNVLATPHIAGAAFEVEEHHSRIMNAAVLEWLNNRSGRCVFNLKQLNK